MAESADGAASCVSAIEPLPPAWHYLLLRRRSALLSAFGALTLHLHHLLQQLETPFRILAGHEIDQLDFECQVGIGRNRRSGRRRGAIGLVRRNLEPVLAALLHLEQPV